MPPTVNIKFYQNDYGVYFSGEVITGKVEITFTKPKKIRGIAMEVCGNASIKFTDPHRAADTVGSTRKKKPRSSRFTGEEEYLAAKTYLVGSDKAIPTELLPGVHTYNFACALPSLVPSSFEGTHGYIRYVAKVILEQAWKFNQTYSVGFTVLKSVDLNYDSPLLKMPAEIETTKIFWCGFCTSQQLHIKLRLSQTGFVPGQKIPIEIEINNSSDFKIADLRFSLKQAISYRADKPMNNFKEEIVHLITKKCSQPQSESYWRFEEKLEIPPLPPTSIYHSKIIQINYEIQVEAITPGGHRNLFLICPITIGTVPLISENEEISSLAPSTSSFQTAQITEQQLESSISNIQSNNRRESMPVVTRVLSRRGSAVPNNYNIPPPSYEESIIIQRVQVDGGAENPIQRNEFTPRYPVYNFENFTNCKISDIIEKL